MNESKQHYRVGIIGTCGGMNLGDEAILHSRPAKRMIFHCAACCRKVSRVSFWQGDAFPALTKRCRPIA